MAPPSLRTNVQGHTAPAQADPRFAPALLLSLNASRSYYTIPFVRFSMIIKEERCDGIYDRPSQVVGTHRDFVPSRVCAHLYLPFLYVFLRRPFAYPLRADRRPTFGVPAIVPFISSDASASSGASALAASPASLAGRCPRAA